MSPRVYRLCTLLLVLIGTDAKVSNKEIYNQRNPLNPNLGHHDGVQNNTASATSLIIRGDNGKNNSNGSLSRAANNHSTQDEQEQGGSDNDKDIEKVLRIRSSDSGTVNSPNGAALRSNSNYDGEKLTEESRAAELVQTDGKGPERMEYEPKGDNEDLMNDGFHTEAPAAATVPSFIMGQRSNEPSFDPSTKQNVTALVGKSAYLNCRVRNLGNKTVSWIRHRDIHILTVGGYTYTSDQRFQATHHKETEDWILQVKWVQKRDAGKYECQVSTQPVQSYFVNLEVVVPTAYIIGGPDLHVDKGSTINLTCSVRYSPEPPAYIFWFHHDEVISYDSIRGGVSVITEKGDVTTSYLLIQNADLADSGKYSCSPSNADVASVRVHVLNGEHPEAMQTAGAAAIASCNVPRWNVLMSLIITSILVLPLFIRYLVHYNDRTIDARTIARIPDAGKIVTFNVAVVLSSTQTSSAAATKSKSRR